MMTGETVTATVTNPSVMQTITNKMIEYTDAIIAAMPVMVDKAGEAAIKAWEIAMQVKQLEGIGNLTQGAVVFLTSTALGYVTYRLIKRANNSDLSYSTQSDAGFGACWTGAATVVLFAISMTILTDIWNWASVFAPEAAIAHDIWLKLTETTKSCSSC